MCNRFSLWHVYWQKNKLSLSLRVKSQQQDFSELLVEEKYQKNWKPCSDCFLQKHEMMMKLINYEKNESKVFLISTPAWYRGVAREKFRKIGIRQWETPFSQKCFYASKREAGASLAKVLLWMRNVGKRETFSHVTLVPKSLQWYFLSVIITTTISGFYCEAMLVHINPKIAKILSSNWRRCAISTNSVM